MNRLLVLALLALTSTAAVADPVSFGMAVGSLMAGSATAWVAYAGYALVVASAVYGSMEQRRKARNAERQRKDDYNSNLEDRTVVTLQADPPIRTVYGNVDVGGFIVAMFTTDKPGADDRGQAYTRADGLRHLVIALAHHECQAVTDMKIDGVSVGTRDANFWVNSGTYGGVARTATKEQWLSAGQTITAPSAITSWDAFISQSDGDGGSYTTNVKANFSISPDQKTITCNSGTGYVTWQYQTIPSSVRWQAFLGTATQAADPYLLSILPGEWTATDRLQGITYVVVTLDLERQEFQNGLPGMSFSVSGKKLFDPRTSLTVFSTNPALIARDWLTQKYGLNIPVDEVDDASVIAAANACDVAVNLTVGTTTETGVAKWVASGVADSTADKESVLDDICASMAGYAYAGPSWTLMAGAWAAPVLTLGDTDLAGQVELVQAGAGIDEVFNGLRTSFMPDGSSTISEGDPYQNAVHLAADGRELWSNVTLGFVGHRARVKNIARIMVERSRDAMIIRFPAKMVAWPLKVGERVTVTNTEYSFVGKTFRVTDWQFGLQAPVMLTLQEDVAEIWDLADAATAEQAPNTNFPSPWDVPVLTGLVVSSGSTYTQVMSDGTLIERALVTWNRSTNPYVLSNGKIRIRWRKVAMDALDTWRTQEVSGDSVSDHLLGVKGGEVLTVVIQAINSLGQEGPIQTTSHAVVATANAAQSVAGFTGTVGKGRVTWSWSPYTRNDYRDTEIRSADADWGSNLVQPLFRGRVNKWDEPVSAAGTLTRYVRHFTAAGVSSAATQSASAVVAATDLVVDGRSLTLTSTAQAITFDTTGAASPSSQTITFTANLQGITGTAVFTATGFNAAGTSLGAITLGGTGNTRTLTNALFGAAAYVQVSATLSGFTDSMTIVRLKDGASSVVALLTNEAHTVTVNPDGTGGDYSTAIGTLKVYYGLTDVTSTSTFAVVAGSATGITGAAINSSGAYSITGCTTDTGVVTFRATYSGTVIDKVFTVSKARKGVDTVIGYLTAENVSVPADSAGTVSSFASAAGTFEVYDGTVRRTISGTVTYSVVAGGTATATIGTGGSYSVTAMTGDVATVTFQAVYGSVTLQKTLTVAKQKAGAAGTAGAINDVGALYQWAASAPGNPSGTSVITWATRAQATYTGGNGWSTTVPANPGTPGLQLYTAQKPVTAASGTVSTTIDWTSGFTVSSVGANGATGAAGASGTKFALARAFQWKIAPAPTATGTTTYTWSTNAYAAVPVGWTTTPGTAPSAGFTLWEVLVKVVDAAAATTTSIDWATGAISAVGYAGTNGSAGAQGGSGRVAYAKSTSSSLSATPATTTTAGSTSFPATNTWGGAEVWGSATPTPAAGEWVYQTNGVYDPATGNTVWSAPFVATFRVGSLSALSANLGTITAGSISIGGRASIDANGYAVFKGVRVEDELGNVVLETKTGSVASVPSTWVDPDPNWQNSNLYVSVTGVLQSGIATTPSDPKNLLSYDTFSTLSGGWAALQSVAGEATIAFTSSSVGPKGIQQNVLNATKIGTDAATWDGGYMSPSIIPDVSKKYRMVMPVRRWTTGTVNGTVYFGINPAFATPNIRVFNQDGTTANDNAYFSSIGTASLVAQEWYLLVGYIFPLGSTNVDAQVTDGGLWRMSTKTKQTAGTNFVFQSVAGTLGVGARAGVNGATTASQLVQFGMPFVHVCDGTEPELWSMFEGLGLRAMGFTGDLNATNDIQLSFNPFMEVDGNTVKKINSSALWDGAVWSKNSFKDGAYVSFVVDQTNLALMVGLNTDPVTNNSHETIDYAWYLTLTGTLECRAAGAIISGSPTTTTRAVGDVLAIQYDGSKVLFLKNNTVVYTHTTGVPVGATMYLDSSFYSLGASVSGLRFGPLSNNNWVGIGGARPIQFYAFARGASSTTHPAGYTQGVGNLDTATHYGTTARSYRLDVFQRSNMALVYSEQYDVYAGAAANTSLNNLINGLLWSEDFSNVVWLSDAPAVTRTLTAGVVLEDGSTGSVMKITEATTSSTQVLYQPYALSLAATPLLAYFDLKAGERSFARVTLGTASVAIGAQMVVDLSTGTISTAATLLGTATGLVSSITALGNGWYRCAIGCTFPATATVYAGVYIRSTNSTASYVGTAGSGLYVKRAQLEYGTLVSKYRLTTTSARYLSASALAEDLNAQDSSRLVVVTTFDEPTLNRLTGGLDTAMYRCGASPAVFGSPNWFNRAAYVLIGIGGCGTGNGYESYAGEVVNDVNAWVLVSFSMQNGLLNVSGQGSNPKQLTDYGYTGDLNATFGADWASNVSGIPYDKVFNNDDSVALGFNPTFAWTVGNTYPDNWSLWAGTAPTRETTLVRIGQASVRYTTSGGTNFGITRTTDFTTTPLPAGTFLAGSVDMYLVARTSGLPGIMIRLFTNAAKTTSVDTHVQPPSTVISVWQRVPWTARVPAGQQIYGIQIYIMASWTNFVSGVFTGTVVFDNMRFMLADSTTDNTVISLSPTGALTGAGGGQMTTLPAVDTRSTNAAPSAYLVGVTTEMKQRSVIGAPGTQTYGLLKTEKQWNDQSGGVVTQTFKSADGEFKRTSTPGNYATWDAWSPIVDRQITSANVSTFIADLAITNAKIGNIIKSDNYEPYNLYGNWPAPLATDWAIFTGSGLTLLSGPTAISGVAGAIAGYGAVKASWSGTAGGGYLTAFYAQKRAVDPGDTIELQAYVQCVNGTARMLATFHNAAGTPVGQPVIGTMASATPAATTVQADFTRFSGQAVAPAGAATVYLEIQVARTTTAGNTDLYVNLPFLAEIFDGQTAAHTWPTATGGAGWIVNKNGNSEMNNGVWHGKLDVKSSASGERMEIKNNVIRIYDASNVLRVKIGDLS
jgi:hypothetical protein